MTTEPIAVGIANLGDLNGIMLLQEQNLAINNGTLSSGLAEETIKLMMQEMPIIVTRQGDDVVGFMMSATLERNANIPIVHAMLSVYRGGDNAYLYGPVCVSEKARNKGLAKKMFEELKLQIKGRQGVLFIRNDNAPSINAHKNMGMQAVAEFSYNDAAYTVFSFFS
ncbi:GNAT family N-acetyltransferase [Serratia sp. M24T3]|uniref:GNAT family N-acetyltransferase n=1 Tax=Serratia sp. M24T3 TaxID=932213 RepID=UPI00025B90C2|nr:GNAT family N-acetyltransferase [Serratia sp. M24T3]EIC84987.1 gcn5-related n-acetyltransferase [Serratia sp. M24T3]